MQTSAKHNVHKNFKVIQNPGFRIQTFFRSNYPPPPSSTFKLRTLNLLPLYHRVCYCIYHRFAPDLPLAIFLLTHRQTNKLWQKHNLFGGGNYLFLPSPSNILARWKAFFMFYKFLPDILSIGLEILPLWENLVGCAWSHNDALIR